MKLFNRVSAGDGDAAADALAARLAPLQAWWRRLAARERQLLSLAGAVVVLGLVWALAVAPAWRTLRSAPTELAQLDAQLAAMRVLAQEAQQLRATPPVPREQARAALQRATEALGAKARLSLQGDRAVVTLDGLEPGALANWLQDLRSAARARPLEASLTRNGSAYSGTVVLALGGAP